ncbi:MAG: response regulator [bacterium]
MIRNKIKNKILIVEDEILMLKTLVSTLNNHGFSTLEAQDGEQGLAIALKEKPDLILLDTIMPKMDGLAMLKELRKKSWGKKVPIIFLTNLSDSEKIIQATKNYTKTLDNIAYEYLIKSDYHLSDVERPIEKSIEK